MYSKNLRKVKVNDIITVLAYMKLEFKHPSGPQ